MGSRDLPGIARLSIPYLCQDVRRCFHSFKLCGILKVLQKRDNNVTTLDPKHPMVQWSTTRFEIGFEVSSMPTLPVVLLLVVAQQNWPQNLLKKPAAVRK